MIQTLILFYLAFLVNTQFNFGTLKVIFVGFVFIHYFLIKRQSGIGRYSLILLSIYLIGTLGSLIYMAFYPAAYADMTNILLRGRAFVIEIFFAIALYLFLKDKSIDYVLKLLLIGVVANAVVGSAQFLLEPFSRIKMLFPEPSAAGYYYLFVFFILVEKFRQGWPMVGSRYFMVLGLAIGSKAQYALLLAVGILHYLSPRRLAIFLSILITFTYLFRSEIVSIPAVKYNLHVAEIYWDQGLSGLNSSNRVWNTYSTRIGAIEGSLRCIAENPLGIGFGSFNSWFQVHMKNSGLDNPEINAVLWGRAYASSKSNLLELFVATGVFGMALYAYIGSHFFRYRRVHSYLFKSFVALTLASFFIELSPMFTYITVLWILLEKERQNAIREHHG